MGGELIERDELLKTFCLRSAVLLARICIFTQSNTVTVVSASFVGYLVKILCKFLFPIRKRLVSMESAGIQDEVQPEEELFSLNHSP